MDVRCENCGTEYELDDTKLKASGVTVKCTHCGHMFKVRRRVSTEVGVPGVSASSIRRQGSNSAPEMSAHWPGQSGDPSRATAPMAVMSSKNQPLRQKTESGPLSRGRPSPELRQPAQASPIPQGLHVPPSGPISASTGSKERLWLIRLPDGEVETCRELATLQQWIVSGKVNRSSGISRTGKTWKPLGEIAELASFFAIADEAQQARSSHGDRSPGRVSPGSAALAGPSSGPGATFDVGETQPVDPSMSPAPGVAPGVFGAQPAAPQPMQPAGPAGESGGWSGNLHAEQSGPSGPVGGIPSAARGPEFRADMSDVAFGSSQIPDHLGAADAGASAGFQPDVFADENDHEDLVPPRSSAARWIVLFSLVLMAGAAFVVYFMVFRETTGEDLVAVPPDAGVIATTATDAATEVVPDDPAPPPPTTRDEILAKVDEHILYDDRAVLEADEGQLDQIEGGASDPGVMFARARIHTALAQHAIDEADALDDDDDRTRERKKQLTRQAKQRVLDAFTLARKARKLEPDEPAISLLLADIARLQDKRTRDVERQLDKAKKNGASSRDAVLVRALTLAREAKNDDARRLLGELASGAGDLSQGGDVRPLYRLAVLDMAEKKYDDARRRAEVITAARPEHSGARALLARIEQATAIDTSDPLPPEEGGEDPANGDKDDGDSESSFDALLTKADRKAENGDCPKAMELYERALDLEPTSVAALTGMGYCHIDRKEFASAHGKFKAALAVSSRYQDALWGIAEAYQQQGLARQSVEAYKRFLEEHPTSPRAARAKKQIEKLGGTVDSVNSGNESGGSESGGESGKPEPGSGESAGEGTGDRGGKKGESAGSGGESSSESSGESSGGASGSEGSEDSSGENTEGSGGAEGAASKPDDSSPSAGGAE